MNSVYRVRCPGLGVDRIIAAPTHREALGRVLTPATRGFFARLMADRYGGDAERADPSFMDASMWMSLSNHYWNGYAWEVVET